MILAGDVGGTKCNLALLEKHQDRLLIRHQRRFVSRQYSQLSDLIAPFLAETREAVASSRAGKIEAAGFGVAGPVIGKRVNVTNLGWELDGGALARQIGIRRVAMLNDLEATAYGLPWLKPEQLHALNAGKPRLHAAKALIAAGTGLGESLLHWDGQRYLVAPTEGGHCDFAPRTDEEIELLRYMKRIEEPVSFEMILSGRGFERLHEFLDASVRHSGFEDPEIDAAPEVTRRGLDGSCQVCVRALHLWVSLYGAEAGNLALKTLSLGGVYVAGGIAPRIMPKMSDGTFVEGFCRKSKFAALLAEIPVYVILSEEAPLFGAAAEAARLNPG
jgi:glucokinase